MDWERAAGPLAGLLGVAVGPLGTVAWPYIAVGQGSGSVPWFFVFTVLGLIAALIAVGFGSVAFRSADWVVGGLSMALAALAVPFVIWNGFWAVLLLQG